MTWVILFTIGRGLHHVPRTETYRPVPNAGRSTVAASLGRGLAAVALCTGGALITGLASTTPPAGAANPSPVIYEIDNGANAINVFPATASGNTAPAVHITADANF